MERVGSQGKGGVLMEEEPLQSELTEQAQGLVLVGKQPWETLLLGSGWRVAAQGFAAG